MDFETKAINDFGYDNFRTITKKQYSAGIDCVRFKDENLDYGYMKELEFENFSHNENKFNTCIRIYRKAKIDLLNSNSKYGFSHYSAINKSNIGTFMDKIVYQFVQNKLDPVFNQDKDQSLAGMNGAVTQFNQNTLYGIWSNKNAFNDLDLLCDFLSKGEESEMLFSNWLNEKVKSSAVD